MLKRVILAAALAMCLTATAHAETNRAIYKSCAAEDVDAKNYDTFCKPYVKAIVRTLYPLSRLSGCLPSGISLAYIEDELIIHMFNEREEWGLNFIQLYDSMMSGWKCPSIYEVHRGAAILKDLKKQKTGANHVKKPLKDDDLNELMMMEKEE